MAINNLTREDAFNFQTQCELRYNTLNQYQNLATRSAIYPGQGTPLGLAYVALKMNGEAGEFAEHVGKAMRDDGVIGYKTRIKLTAEGHKLPITKLAGNLTAERRELLIKEIGDVLWYLSAACNELGISLSEAAVTNLQKLADRSERGKLQGSGDER